MANVIEINCATGEVTERPLTAEEIAQREADAIKAEADRLLAEEEVNAKATAKALAHAKLAKLGLTPEDIEAL